MLITVGEHRSAAIDIRLATSLSAIAGAVNAGGFRATGYFSANMTGNVSAASDYAALGQWAFVLFFMAMVFSFIAGAFVSALLIELGRRRQIAGIYAYSILAEALLLGSLALADITLPAVVGAPVLLAGLSFLMGLQNAATTRISNARVRTSHVSGIATDLGVELAVLLGGARDDDTRPVVRDRFKLHIYTILAFLLGGVAGVLAYDLIGAGLFVALAVVLCAIALPEARRARRPSATTV